MPAPVSSTSQLPELAQHLTGSDAFAAAQPNRSTKKTMKPSDLESLLSRDQELLLCDVRTKIEYDNIHLKQAKNIPLDTIEGKAIENTFSKDKLTVFVCKSGARSQTAFKRLKAAGYDNIDFVDGGTDQCHKEGMEIIENKKVMSLERQVRIAAGMLVLMGVGLSLTVTHAFIALSAFIGAGLVFAGVTKTCGMGLLLAKAPWNK
jgi:rhodanese-related sulfurtransferase